MGGNNISYSNVRTEPPEKTFIPDSFPIPMPKKPEHPRLTSYYCPRGCSLAWKNFEYDTFGSCSVCQSMVRSIDGAKVCSGGCIYCKKCANEPVCANPEHKMGPLNWTWEELRERADYNQDKLDYIEKYSLFAPNMQKTCMLCGKSVGFGFSCKCDYCVCTESVMLIRRNPRTCINGHTLTITLDPGKLCAMCGKFTQQIWNCDCGFALCTKCEPTFHNMKTCPDGHPLERMTDRVVRCFLCQQERSDVMTCPFGYSLCLKCIKEISGGALYYEDTSLVNAKTHLANKKCQMCMTKNAEIVFGPCRHTEVCVQCSGFFIQCPVCYVMLEDKERIDN